MSRDQERSRRKHPTRARTINGARLPYRAIATEVGISESDRDGRPRVRGDCAGGERPCPWVSCKWHLYLDVGKEVAGPKAGRSIKLNFPDLEVDQVPETCALDVADRGGMKFEDVGERMNMTRERVRQIEVEALGKIRKYLPLVSE